MSLRMDSSANSTTAIHIDAGTLLKSSFTFIACYKMIDNITTNLGQSGIMYMQTTDALYGIETGPAGSSNVHLMNNFSATPDLRTNFTWGEWTWFAMVGYSKAGTARYRAYMKPVKSNAIEMLEVDMSAAGTNIIGFHHASPYIGYQSNTKVAYSKIWAIPLTPEQVLLEMNSPIPIRMGNLLDYNPFNGGSLADAYLSKIKRGGGGGLTMGAWKTQYYDYVDRGGGVADPIIDNEQPIIFQTPAHLRRKGFVFNAPYPGVDDQPVVTGNNYVTGTNLLSGNIIVPATLDGDSQLIAVSYMPGNANLALPSGWTKELEWRNFTALSQIDSAVANVTTKHVFLRREMTFDNAATNVALTFSGMPNVTYTAMAINVRNGSFRRLNAYDSEAVQAYVQYPSISVTSNNSLVVQYIGTYQYPQDFTKPVGSNLVVKANISGTTTLGLQRGVGGMISTSLNAAQGVKPNIYGVAKTLHYTTGAVASNIYSSFSFVYAIRPRSHGTPNVTVASQWTQANLMPWFTGGYSYGIASATPGSFGSNSIIIVENSATISHTIYQGVADMTGNVQYTLSADVRRVTGNRNASLWVDCIGGYATIQVDLDSGTIYSSPRVQGAAAINMGNGWWRISMITSSDASMAGGVYWLELVPKSTSLVSDTYTGDGTSSLEYTNPRIYKGDFIPWDDKKINATDQTYITMPVGNIDLKISPVVETNVSNIFLSYRIAFLNSANLQLSMSSDNNLILVDTVKTVANTYIYTLNANQIASITNWSNISVNLKTANTGPGFYGAGVSMIHFDVPAARRKYLKPSGFNYKESSNL